MEKLIKEKAENTAQWILRREGCLKAAHVDKVIENDLESIKRIAAERAINWYCKRNCSTFPCLNYCQSIIELIHSIENE